MMLNNWLEKELDKLSDTGLYREPFVFTSAASPEIETAGRKYMAFCSNDYLGLAADKRLSEAASAASERWGVGAGASRLISGSLQIHRDLEQKIAKLKRSEDALLFPTGYMANVGTLSALMDSGDVIISDELNHASIIDGCRLSRADVRTYSHANIDHLRTVLKKCGGYRNRLIVTDGVFSMDGDLAPIADIVELAKEFEAWVMIDDAHGTGVLGKTGGGVLEHFGLEGKAEIVMGTLSKALGTAGGFICGSGELIALLRNRARSFIYTTAISPAICGAALKALEILEREPERLGKLRENAILVRSELINAGFITPGEKDLATPIVPLITGTIEDTATLSAGLLAEGVFVPAIRPPTVPEGQCRLRITVSASHSRNQIDKLISIMRTLI